MSTLILEPEVHSLAAQTLPRRPLRLESSVVETIGRTPLISLRRLRCTTAELYLSTDLAAEARKEVGI